MANKGAVVVGSLAALALLSAIAIALSRRKESGSSSSSSISPDTALEWLNTALGMPTSVSTVTRPSGRTYQIAIWALTDKEAVLITCLSPKTVFAVQRDKQDRTIQTLAEIIPDETARTDVAELGKNF